MKKTREELLAEIEALQAKVNQQQAAAFYHEQIMETIGEAISIVDKNYTYLFVNKAYSHFFGVSTNQIIGQKLHHFLGVENVEKQVKPHFQRCLQGEIVHYRYSGVLAGHNRYMEMNYYPYRDSNNQIAGIISIGYDVTKEEELKQQLAISKRSWVNSFNALEDTMLIISKDFTIEEVNESGVKLLNRTKDQIVGKKCYEIIHHCPTPSCECPFMESMQNKTATTTEMREEISGRHYSIKTSPVFDENGNVIKFIDLIRDITQLEESQKALQESQMFFQTIFEQATAGIVQSSPEGKIELVNQKFCDIVGYTKKELLRFQFQDITHPNDWELQRKEIERIYNREISSFSTEKRYIHKKGHSVWVQLHFNVIRDNEGNVKSAIGVVTDITAEKEYRQNLLKAKEKAEENDRLKSAFLANMSHEIRTPVHGIIGFAEMLNRPRLSPERRSQYSRLVADSSQQLMKIINDVIDISKIETGQIEKQEEAVLINDMMLDIFTFYQTVAKKNNIRIYLEPHLPDSETYILTDEVKLKQIISNLIDNAIKFTHEGYIKLLYQRKNEQIEFCVEDTGIGISDELQDAIFERFRQADVGDARKYGGTGLGLTIARSYAILLDGKLWVESKEGKGSRFYLSIPYKAAKQTEQEPNDIQTTTDTILIAEDEQINFLFLHEMLLDTGRNIIHAQNGREAVELCATNHDIKLVIMDVKMPKMDGYTATKEIKKIRPDLPIIAQTAFALAHERQRAMQAGCDDYIAKPFNEADFIEKVKLHLSK